MPNQFVIVRVRSEARDVVLSGFASRDDAEDAYVNLGCYLDDVPEPGDDFEIQDLSLQ
jgi:hypothetical protein